MLYSLPYKTKQIIFVLIKLSIIVAAFYYIFIKLTKNVTLNLHDFLNYVVINNIFSLKNSTILMVLSCLNWFFEIIKWKTLVSFIKKITLKEATKQTLGALTASLFTPNRIGEYGAKAMFYQSNTRKRVVGINIISNLLQMAITCALGVVGLTYFIAIYPIQINYAKLTIIISLSLIAMGAIGLILSHVTFQKSIFSTQKIKTALLNYPKKKITAGLVFSLIRYLIFSFQFYILLRFFNVHLSYFLAMSALTSMYFITSIIPSLFIFDVVIKGSVAVYLFAFIGVNEITILTIVMLMWIFNFVLPSVIGSYFVIGFKLPKQTAII